MAAGSARYGTMPGHDLLDPQPAKRGVRRHVLAAAGLSVCAIAFVAVVLGSSSRSTQPVSLGSLDIAKMEDDMFENPQHIYQQTLSDALHSKPDDSDLAWANPTWKADARKRKSALAVLEKDIVAGVTKQLASRVSHQVSRELAGMLQGRGVAMSKKQNLLRSVNLA